MRALLLAAGFGTRLLPLTEQLPKCLVPIKGRPLLDYWLDNLLNNGVEEVLVNTHYLAPLVLRFLNQSSWSPRVTIVHEETLLGTGGTILKNQIFFQGEPFMVVHADNLSIFDVSDFMSHHICRPTGTEMTSMVFATPDPQSCGIVELDSKGVVQDFHEKVANPPGNLANGAIYILEPSVLEWMIGLGKKQVDFSTEVIPHFLGKLFTYQNTRYHRDIGTMKSWIQANRDFPMMPANVKNEKAWSAILKKEDGQLARVISMLGTSEPLE